MIMAILLVASLLAAIFIKLNNQNVYLNTIKVNTAYNDFILLMTSSVTTMKSLNYYMFTNNTSLGNVFYNITAGYVNITSAMDNLVVNFDISAITQTWNTLTCNTTSGDYFLGN